MNIFRATISCMQLHGVFTGPAGTELHTVVLEDTLRITDRQAIQDEDLEPIIEYSVEEYCDLIWPFAIRNTDYTTP